MPAEFDKFAADYEALLKDPLRKVFTQRSDFFHRRKWILIREFLKRQSFPMARSAWLDVGCGRGELLALGGDSFARAIGCELSAEMSSFAGTGVIQQDSPDVLPFEDGSFDFITAVCVYHHIPEPSRAPLTREIHRVLRPGGWFGMIEHNPLNPVTLLIVKRTPVDRNARLLSSWTANRHLQLAGLASLAPAYFLYLPEPLFERLPNLEQKLSRVPLGGQYAVFGQKPAD